MLVHSLVAQSRHKELEQESYSNPLVIPRACCNLLVFPSTASDTGGKLLQSCSDTTEKNQQHENGLACRDLNWQKEH
eukprot:643834-Amphidinium_carterae.1